MSDEDIEEIPKPKAQAEDEPSFVSKISRKTSSTKVKGEKGGGKNPQAPVKSAVKRFTPKPIPSTAQRVFGAKVGLNHRALLGFLPYDQRDEATHLQKYGFDKYETHNVMERAINPRPSVERKGIIKRGVRGDNVLKW